ncbi:MAG: leucine-rich repeat protein [Clostridia bacterium]|nr:leucine-rich repeat protein [Clostridia bacterium]
MENKKTFLKFTAAVIAALMLLPLSGCIKSRHIAVGAEWDGDYCYTVYDDGTAVIIAYTGSDEILRLPGEYKGKAVIGFGSKTFENCVGLRMVYLPESVTSLPPRLFVGCGDLAAIYVPAAVRSMGKNVISDCPRFKTVLYAGTAEEWEGIDIGDVPWTDNYTLVNAEVVYSVDPYSN